MSEENNDGSDVGDLRKQYELQKKETTKLLEELNGFRKTARQASVAELLKAKGVPVGAAKFYDAEDVSEDAVNKWADAHKDVFGGAVAAPLDGKPGELDQNALAAQRLAAITAGREAAIDTDNRVLGDPEEIMRAIKTLPMEELVKLGYMPADNIR